MCLEATSRCRGLSIVHSTGFHTKIGFPELLKMIRDKLSVMVMVIRNASCVPRTSSRLIGRVGWNLEKESRQILPLFRSETYTFE